MKSKARVQRSIDLKTGALQKMRAVMPRCIKSCRAAQPARRVRCNGKGFRPDAEVHAATGRRCRAHRPTVASWRVPG
eukprot:scaffold18121_cov117-Isochrysis_galbana.AAC.2